MKWNLNKSAKLKRKIARDPKLVEGLTKKVEGVFKEYKVQMSGVSYVFEPRVFSMNAEEALELTARSRASMVAAIMGDLAAHVEEGKMNSAIDASKYTACLPQCGPMDPFSLKVLEKLRIRKMVNDEPLPITTSGQLMRRIVGNKKLMNALSSGLFKVLEEAGIKFSSREGCVFTPVVFQSPVFAQKIGVAEDISELEGFGPQLYAYADPTPEPASAIMVKPFPGIIEVIDHGFVPGVIIDRWWWIGIPAPELLQALDVAREYQ